MNYLYAIDSDNVKDVDRGMVNNLEKAETVKEEYNNEMSGIYE